MNFTILEGGGRRLFLEAVQLASYDANAHLGIVLHHQRLAEPLMLHPSGIAFPAFCALD